MCPDKAPAFGARQVTGRYFLRASKATQIKKPTIKTAKPTNATTCSELALAKENAV